VAEVIELDRPLAASAKSPQSRLQGPGFLPAIL
jgi:hypothetical protein